MSKHKQEPIPEEKNEMSISEPQPTQEEKKPETPAESKENTLQKEVEECKDKYLRLLAEMENMRKRIQKEKEEGLRFAIENTIGEFLPVLENLENAMKFAQAASEEVKNWSLGFQMILSQFREIFHNYGVVAFHSEGTLFDPHCHEVMEILETPDYPEGTVLAELAKGYKCGSRILRPARVKIAKAPPQKASEEEIINRPLT